MRILIAGASGVIGRATVPRLLEDGHTICATSRGIEPGMLPDHPELEVCRLDLLDAAEVRAVVEAFDPDAVIHIATAIPGDLNPRRVERELAPTNRLRTEGTANLLAAIPPKRQVRFVAESFALAYAPGKGLADEGAPLYRTAPGGFAPAVAALASLEQQVADAANADGVVLRFGALYGEGTSYAEDGPVASRLRKRAFPQVSDGTGVWSFLHVEDAAEAIVHALDIPPGVYNAVDDDPVRVSDWLGSFAGHLGAPAPRRVPAWLARLIIGRFGLHVMLTLRGVSNRRFVQVSGWSPRSRPW